VNRLLALVAATLWGCSPAGPTPAAPDDPAAVVGSVTPGEAPAQAKTAPPITLVPQTGHVTQIWAVAEGPDGRLIATGGFDHTIRLWLQTGEVLAVLKGHEEAITSVAFSPDGKRLASAARDQTARIWDLSRGGKMTKLPTAAMTVSWHPSGETLLTAGYDQEVKLWDVPSGELSASRAVAKRQLLAAAFSPDGQRIVARGLDGEVTILATKTLATVAGAQVAAGYSRSISISPDSRRVALGSGKGIGVLEMADGTVAFVAQKAGVNPYRGAFSPDGRTIASVGGGNWVHLWDGGTGQYLRGFAQADGVESLAWSQDGTRIITGGDDPLARVFDAATGDKLLQLGSGADAPRATMSPDGTRIAKLGPKRVEVIDLRTAEVVGHFRVRNDHYTSRPVWSPTGRWLASSSLRGVEVWDAQSFTRIAALRLPNPQKDSFSVAFSPDEATVAVGVTEQLVLWDVKTRKVIHSVKLPSWIIGGLAFSPDGKLLGVGTREGVSLHDPSNGKRRTLLDVKQGVSWGALVKWAWGPDSQRLVACASQQAQLWNVATGQLEAKIKSANNFARPVFGPQGVVLSAGKQRLMLWDGQTARTIPTHHQRLLRSFAITKRWLATGGDDGRVLFFDGEGKYERSAPTRHAGRVWQLHWHPAGEVLLSSSQDVFLHRAADGAIIQLRTVTGPAGPVGVAHTADGRFVADPAAHPGLFFRVGDDLTTATLAHGGEMAQQRARPELLRAFWAGQPLP